MANIVAHIIVGAFILCIVVPIAMIPILFVWTLIKAVGGIVIASVAEARRKP